MNVFFLFETGNYLPIAVFSDPDKVHCKEEDFSKGFGESIIPGSDTKLISREKKLLCEYKNKEVVARWQCYLHGTVFVLQCFHVL